MSRRLLHPLAVAALLLAAPAAAEVRILAFGDSITLGYGDSASGGGYPQRLQSWLRGDGFPVTVLNRGIGGETTAQGLARIGSVLDEGGDLLLLMEGTNDVFRNLSTETILYNLNALATHAEARGMRVVQATIVPHRPDGEGDNDNEQTLALRGAVLGLALRESRPVVDAFGPFWSLPGFWQTHYLADPDDPVGHPNAAGYDLLAEAFHRVVEPLVAHQPSGRIVPRSPAPRTGELAWFDIDLPGPHAAVRWRFGDGGRTEGVAENGYAGAHLYLEPGTYEVEVEVITLAGARLTDRIMVTVSGDRVETLTASSLVPLARRERRGPGSAVRSALWVTNLGGGPVRVELEPLPASPPLSGAIGKAAALPLALSLGPWQSVALPDALLALGIAEGNAAIRLRARGPAARGIPRIRAEVRIADEEAGAVTGWTTVPAVPENDWRGSPRGGILRALSADAPAALLLANPESSQRSVAVRLRSATGTELGSAHLTLTGRASLQRSLSRLFPAAASALAPFGLEIETDGALVAALEQGMAGGRDRLFSLLRPRAASGSLLLPIAGDHAPGRSRRLYLFNPDPTPASLNLSLLRGDDGGSSLTVAMTLAGGESREIAEPRLLLFGGGEGAGLLRAVWAAGRPAPHLAATLDTQPLAPVGLGDIAGAEGSLTIPLGASMPLPPPGSGWTSTLRILETGERATTLRVELLDALGELLGIRYLSLNPGGLSERALASLFPGPVDGLGWQLWIEIESGGPIVVWLLSEHADGDASLALGRPSP